MKQTTGNNNSRTRILESLRNACRHQWQDNWSGEVPEGAWFPEIKDLAAAFRSELSTLGGEVFFEENETAVSQRLKKILQEKKSQNPVVIDQTLIEKCEKWAVNIADFDADAVDFEVGITRCEALIALTGGVLVCSMGPSGRRMNVFPPVHIVMASRSQLVQTIDEGFGMIEKKYEQQGPSQISLISGPSRTADIEKTLVMGAHGPRELIVLVNNKE